MSNDTIGLIKQRLEILYQMVDQLETGGGGSPTDAYTKAQTNALLATKVDKVAGSSLMTTAQANKLAGIESGAEVNVQADWDQTDITADDFIKNKPVIPDTSNFYTKSEVDSELNGKVDKQTGYSLISNANITKLNGIAAGAEVNVQPNWNETDTTSDSYIRNKPTIPDLTNYYNKTQTDAEIQGAITDLDVPSTATTGHYIKSIAQENGLISAVAETVDTTPTTGSSKLITSGGVEASQRIQDNEIAVIANAGAKSLLPIGVSNMTYANAVTFSIANDGIITVNGTNPNGYAGMPYADLVEAKSSQLETRYTLPIGKYKISSTGDGLKFQVHCHDGTNASALFSGKNGGEFEYTSELKAQYPYICWRLAIDANASFSNQIVKPMIWNAEIKDSTFQPYAPTNRELYEMILALQNGGV